MVLSTFLFCALLVLFGRLNPIHFKNKSLVICLRWRGTLKQSNPSLASLRTLANTWLHDLHSDWSARGWESMFLRCVLFNSKSGCLVCRASNPIGGPV